MIQKFSEQPPMLRTNLRPNRPPRNCGCLALALADVEQNLDKLKSKDTFIVGSDTSYMTLLRMYFTSPSHKVPNHRASSNLDPPACPSPFITPRDSTAALPSQWYHVTAWCLHHVSMLLSISDTINTDLDVLVLQELLWYVLLHNG